MNFIGIFQFILFIYSWHRLLISFCIVYWAGFILCCVLFINQWYCMKFKLENEVNIEIEWIKQTNKWHWFFGFWTNPSKYIYFRCKSTVFQSFLENFINSWAEQKLRYYVLLGSIIFFHAIVLAIWNMWWLCKACLTQQKKKWMTWYILMYATVELYL